MLFAFHISCTTAVFMVKNGLPLQDVHHAMTLNVVACHLADAEPSHLLQCRQCRHSWRAWSCMPQPRPGRLLLPPAISMQVRP